jgi:hypothetical protein
MDRAACFAPTPDSAPAHAERARLKGECYLSESFSIKNYDINGKGFTMEFCMGRS